MDEFEFQDPQFISASESQLNLSIQIAGEFISYAIQEKAGNKLFYLKYIPYEKLNNWSLFAERLEKIIGSEPNLNRNYSDSKMMWVSDKYTLVPTEYSDEHYLKKLFQLVHPMEELDELNLEELQSSVYKLLYSLPQESAQELTKHWPAVRFYHQIIPLHHIFIKNSSMHAGFAVLVQVYSEFADIIVYLDGQLKLANSYPLHEKTDLDYHLLNICNHFEIDPTSGNICVSDHFMHGLTGHDSLKKYFTNIRFEKPAIPEGNLSLFQSQDLGRYVNLLNLINCE